MKRRIFITARAGGIGAHPVRRFVTSHPKYRIINGNPLTHAGGLKKRRDIADALNDVFEQTDICDYARPQEHFAQYTIDRRHSSRRTAAGRKTLTA